MDKVWDRRRAQRGEMLIERGVRKCVKAEGGKSTETTGGETRNCDSYRGMKSSKLASNIKI